MTTETSAAPSIGDKIKGVRAQLTSPGAPFEVQQLTLADGRNVSA